MKTQIQMVAQAAKEDQTPTCCCSYSASLVWSGLETVWSSRNFGRLSDESESGQTITDDPKLLPKSEQN